MSRVELMNRTLRSLQSGTPDIEACALISDEGLVIASVLPQHVQEARVAGMAATLLSLGTRACNELGRGKLEQVLIRGDNGYAVMSEVGQGVLLLVLTSKDAKLGLIFLDTGRAAQEIRKIL